MAFTARPEIITTKIAHVNSVRVVSKDMPDKGIKLMSNFGESVYLPRNHKDDFSWDKDGLFIIKNVSEEVLTLELSIVQCTGSLVIVRSSRQGAVTMKPGESITRLMKPGEAVTLRSNAARGKGANNL